MKLIVPLLVAGLAGLFALGGSAHAAPSTPGKVPSPTTKPIPQRMAEVLATGDPNAIRFEAGRLRQEGYPAQAAELERAAQSIEAEIAVGKKPAPVYVPPVPAVMQPPPVYTMTSPGQPTGTKPPVYAPTSFPSVTIPPPSFPTLPGGPVMTPISLPSSGPIGLPPASTVPLPKLPAGVVLKKPASGQAYSVPSSKGELVKLWQNKLISLGFNVGAKGADGYYGSDTDGATRLFQTAANVAAVQRVGTSRQAPNLIAVDGIVGPQTLARAAVATTTGPGTPPVFIGAPYPMAASPLPGLVPPMMPGVVDPRRALVARVVTDLLTCPPGQENKTMVAALQAQEGQKASGYYGPGLATAIGARYGVIPPKPLYWPKTATGKSKANYKAALATLAESDPQRVEEWQRAAIV